MVPEDALVEIEPASRRAALPAHRALMLASIFP